MIMYFVGGQGRNADALALYFGEDPARCPFEQGKLSINTYVVGITFIPCFNTANFNYIGL